ncbi:uncharacterized protein J3D65DRAFT_635826 [Phyllosticta citribraziliensis]|uniref:Uncharacterized protein n=1 Tax=Phyllosticta citribraziliensis TaxID=989973 RepID=A0ABR1LA59_9PEZI
MADTDHGSSASLPPLLQNNELTPQSVLLPRLLPHTDPNTTPHPPPQPFSLPQAPAAQHDIHALRRHPRPGLADNDRHRGRRQRRIRRRARRAVLRLQHLGAARARAHAQRHVPGPARGGLLRARPAARESEVVSGRDGFFGRQLARQVDGESVGDGRRWCRREQGAAAGLGRVARLAAWRGVVVGWEQRQRQQKITAGPPAARASAHAVLFDGERGRRGGRGGGRGGGAAGRGRARCGGRGVLGGGRRAAVAHDEEAAERSGAAFGRGAGCAAAADCAGRLCRG